ncbi:MULTISPECIES: hypothetical protein [unclassified Acinetobacter]|uniref:hypothetical protein n=1 Tax=unclassified Acinetobacter TaxID=196816 RepID=UPI0035BB5DAD
MIIFLVLILFGLKHYLSNKVAEKNQHITPTPIETARPAQSYPSTKYLPKLPIAETVAKLQNPLPKELFVSQHLVKATAITQHDKQVIITVKDESSEVMSIEAVQALYCEDTFFNELRQTEAIVDFAVQAFPNVNYTVNDAGQGCR